MFIARRRGTLPERPDKRRMNFWDGGLWAADLGMPLPIVNHSTAEKPGMQAMAGYLREKVAAIPVEYLDVEFPYTVL